MCSYRVIDALLVIIIIVSCLCLHISMGPTSIHGASTYPCALHVSKWPPRIHGASTYPCALHVSKGPPCIHRASTYLWDSMYSWDPHVSVEPLHIHGASAYSWGLHVLMWPPCINVASMYQWGLHVSMGLQYPWDLHVYMGHVYMWCYVTRVLWSWLDADKTFLLVEWGFVLLWTSADLLGMLGLIQVWMSEHCNAALNVKKQRYCDRMLFVIPKAQLSLHLDHDAKLRVYCSPDLRGPTSLDQIYVKCLI